MINWKEEMESCQFSNQFFLETVSIKEDVFQRLIIIIPCVINGDSNQLWQTELTVKKNSFCLERSKEFTITVSHYQVYTHI
jgi:hypothetical protein